MTAFWHFCGLCFRRWWFTAFTLIGIGSMVLTYIPAFSAKFSLHRSVPVVVIAIAWFTACFLAYRDEKSKPLRNPVPPGFIILINGASAVGKTTIASRLAKDYNITSVIGTDLIREGLRDDIQRIGEGRGVLLTSSFLAHTVTPKWADSIAFPARVISGFQNQCAVLLGPTLKIIARIRRKRDQAIIEGVNLVASQVFSHIPNDRHNKILLINLYLDNSEKHLLRIRQRGEYRRQAVDETDRYVNSLGAIRAIDDYLHKDAATVAERNTVSVISIENSGDAEIALKQIRKRIDDVLQFLAKEKTNGFAATAARSGA